MLRRNRFHWRRLIQVGLVIAVVVAAPARSSDRSQLLDILFYELANSRSEQQANLIERRIWLVWFSHENKIVEDLMQDLLRARERGDLHVAVDFADRIIGLEPDYAEGWNQRATLYFMLDEYDKSLQDIVETLEREPRHFGALSGRAYIYLKQGRHRQAIATMNRALKIHPFLSLRRIIPNAQGREVL